MYLTDPVTKSGEDVGKLVYHSLISVKDISCTSQWEAGSITVWNAFILIIVMAREKKLIYSFEMFLQDFGSVS